MVHSRYKWVSWIGDGREKSWVAQVPQKSLYEAFYSEEEAANAVRNALKRRHLTLKDDATARASAVGPEPTKYRYVAWREARKRWLVNVPGILFKYFVEQNEALAAVCKASGCRPKDLELGETPGRGNHSVARGKRGKRQLFRTLWNIYSKKARRGQKVPVIPGDLAAALTHADVSYKMYLACPALLICSLRGKDIRWKEFLLKRWRALRKSSDLTPEEAFQLLKGACGDMAVVQKDTKLWMSHVHKGVQYHSGWLPMLQQSLHVLEKAGKAKRSGVLKLSEGQYSLSEFNQPFARSWATYGKVGRLLQSLKIPKTCNEWKDGVEEATRSAQKLGLASLTRRPYLWPWLLRTYFYTSTRRSGLDRMQASPDLLVGDLQAMCPDQNSWAKKLASHTMLASDLFAATSYDGPPELFTMYACTFMSCTKVSQEWLEENRNNIAQARADFEAKHGLPPHPNELLQECKTSPAP